jgi:hypothetical protein
VTSTPKASTRFATFLCEISAIFLSKRANPLAWVAPALPQSRLCYVENGEDGFTSDLSTSVFDFFSAFFASFFTFLISFLTSFFLCFDFPAIAPSCAARQTTSILTPAIQDESGGPVYPPLSLRANFNLRLTFQPSIDVFAHHISGETVALLDYTFKLFALSVDLGKIGPAANAASPDCFT